MSGLRKSSRIRKSITTIDQNLEDDDDDAFITTKPRKTITRSSIKRPSTDDNDEHEMITPQKRQKKKKSTTTTTTKTSPYFDKKITEKKIDSPIKETKKPAKPKPKKKTAKPNITIDENTTLSNDATSVTTKTTTASDDNNSDSDSDDDDDGGWENVQAKPSEEVTIQKLLKEREEKQSTVVNGEVEVSLTSEEVAAAQGRRKKNLQKTIKESYFSDQFTYFDVRRR
ncbi:unnamed protein product [Adineta steineri]|uniref:Uncharacterized protein n=1 Tax=Adineta steineri TaxID=433720 RepID=A0A814XC54_9BILA|nr:unnamed protein product [Adineta steineri]